MNDIIYYNGIEFQTKDLTGQLEFYYIKNKFLFTVNNNNEIEKANIDYKKLLMYSTNFNFLLNINNGYIKSIKEIAPNEKQPINFVFDIIKLGVNNNKIRYYDVRFSTGKYILKEEFLNKNFSNLTLYINNIKDILNSDLNVLLKTKKPIYKGYVIDFYGIKNQIIKEKIYYETRKYYYSHPKKGTKKILNTIT